MKTNYLFCISSAVMLAGCCSIFGGKCGVADDCVLGNWEGRLPYDGMVATSMIFTREDGVDKALVLWRWGSPTECVDVKFEGNSFSLRHPCGQLYRGSVCKDVMMAEIAPCDKEGKPTGEWKSFNAWRNPPIEKASTDDAKFGDPIDLLAEGLDGWKLMGREQDGWTFADGVLSNRVRRDKDGKKIGSYANLISKRSDFYDFNLAYDVRVPEGANSGVYLRGRYEIQTVDSFGQPVDKHNMAAYYGRVTPSVAAEKPAGEWQHVDVTLYRRHLTVILNGVKIIDDAPVVGVTGGAIDADEFVPGPIYIQGDHSDADYRNMILRKAL